MRILTAALVVSSVLAAQLPPPPPPPPPSQAIPDRDVVRRPDPTGTGIIRGRVVAADTGNPIRRAQVNLSPAPPPVTLPVPPPPGTSTQTQTRTVMINGVAQTINTAVSGSINVMGRPRSMTTDAQGVFEFAGLPAGTYRLFASAGQYSAAYLATSYGAKRPNTISSSDPGVPIELAEGQKFDKATIALPRGAVITGRVTDENGDALARVQVYTMFLPTGASRAQRGGGGASTDDLGQFRLFGLAPGDYIIAAESRGGTFVAPGAPPESEEDKIGFLTTYFPATPDETSAQRVRTRTGAETSGVEIRMVSGRLFHISGTVTDSQGRASNRTSGSLARGGNSGFTSFGFSTDEQGRFQMRSIPPGNYRLVVRGRADTPGETPEMAIVPLSVTSDIEGVVVSTGPGAVITGQVMFEQGAPPPSPGQSSPQLRVMATPGDIQGNPGVPSPQPAAVTPDLTFTLKGMMGEFLLRANAPNQYLKSVMLGTEDITDTPREFKTGDRVTVVMTSRASTLEGTVTDAKGTPVADAAIIAFSQEKEGWRYNSIRTRRSSPDAAGHYRMTGLIPGRYYILAAPRDRLSMSPMTMDPAFFEELAKSAITFVVGEDEQRQVDLKMMTGDGG